MVYHFGEFALNRETRQLLARGAEIHLSPKAFELLVMLLANRDRAVSKAELQERLWPSTFVEETNLAGIVVELRHALGDTASSPRFVRTVYRFGYRFVGEVTERETPARSATACVKSCLMVENRTMVLMEGANIVGRAADATIPIDGRGVSRHHVRIFVSNGEARIEDLRSKNGTLLNGQRITTSVRLADGDEIKLGAMTLSFRVAVPPTLTETLAAGT